MGDSKMSYCNVFISYDSSDQHVAYAICAILEQSEVRCWIAPRDVIGNFGKSIYEAIKNCGVFVLVTSSAAQKSPHVLREVDQAVENSKDIIPFRIEEVKSIDALGYYLGPVHWLDALTPRLERHIKILLAKVCMLLELKNPSKPILYQVLNLPQQYSLIKDVIYVAGSFNNWPNAKNGILCADGKILSKFTLSNLSNADGVRTISLNLPAGTYEFKFVTNDFRWLPWVSFSGYEKGEDAAGDPNFRLKVA